jgi:uncharacterized damage-inducible protein DinB
MDAAFFRKLFAYNRWANDRVLERAMALPRVDSFANVPGLSFETLHATLAHIFCCGGSLAGPLGVAAADGPPGRWSPDGPYR